MELALSLGDTPKPFSFLQKSAQNSDNNGNILGKKLDLGFCMDAGDQINGGMGMGMASCSSSDPPPPLQLDLLPFSPVQKPISSPTRRPCPPWLQKKLGGYSGLGAAEIGEDGGEQEGAAASLNSSSPKSNSNSGGGSAMDFAIFRLGKREQLEQQVSGGNNNGGDGSEADRGTSSRGSDEEENGMARKKLRLSKQQSAFLEESFKEHNTLNPKQKLALAKQLNLRPRQVEVWFQNRRARTKLKQTEVDCEYLKRCCETLTEENKRLHKELQELRSLKASHPFYMQLPPTTLTMCPSCERVATTATATAASAAAANNNFSSNN